MSTEVRSLIDQVSVEDKELGDAALILASTGMRKGELLGLLWDDVDLEGAELHVAAALGATSPNRCR
jgi:integrase